MLGINLSGVDSAGGFRRPEAGGYVIRITRAINNPKNTRIEMEFDITEGEFAGYYADLKSRAGFWGGTFSKSYSPKALPFLKSFIELVQECNPDTTGLVIGDFEDIDETKLVGMVIGMVVGEQEYMGNDGKIKTRLDWYNADYCTPDDIRAHNYTVPEFKPMEEKTAPAGARVTDTTQPDPVQGFQQVDNDLPF